MANNRGGGKKRGAGGGRPRAAARAEGVAVDSTPSADNRQIVALPDDIPQEWLNQIKEVVKQGWKTLTITTVLGSSVIAAVVTFAGNYFLENRKAELEAIKARQKEVIGAYGALGEAVQKYKSDLGNAVMTFEYAVKTNDKDFLPNVDNSISTVALQVAQVNEAVEDVRISDPEIKKKTKDSLSELPQLLGEAQTDKNALPKIIELHKNKLDRTLEELKALIEEKRLAIPLEP